MEAWDPASLEKDCYGGRFTAEVWDAKSNQHVPHVRSIVASSGIYLSVTFQDAAGPTRCCMQRKHVYCGAADANNVTEHAHTDHLC